MEIFDNANTFSKYIEELAEKKKQGCFETLVEYCTENSVEAEDIPKLISASLKSKIEIEAINDNLLPRLTSVSLDD